MSASIMLGKNEIAYLADALESAYSKYHRSYSPDTPAAYASIAEEFRTDPDDCELEAPSGTVLDMLIFAVLDFDGKGYTRDSVLEKLRGLKPIPAGVIPMKKLMEMHGKPAYIPDLGEWALVSIESDSRTEDPLPYARGLNFRYDIVRRGLLLTASEA